MKALRFRRGGAGPVELTPVVFRWDLDKTYLKSEFDSLRGLVKIPFEKAEDKVTAPGVAALIRALRDDANDRARGVRVYFVSASPPQIGKAIKEKLALDGIVHDGIVFKNQLQRLMRGRFRDLREQVGFKLTELLKARRTDPPAAREYLFGDDWESDPLIYSLYADVVAGRVRAEELSAILREVRVNPRLIEEACSLAEDIAPVDAVGRIFISLERRTPPANLRLFGSRLVPTFNYLQTAACLFQEGVLDGTGVAKVGYSLRQHSYTPERLANSLNDIRRRGYLAEPWASALLISLRDAQLLPAEGRPRAGRWRLWWQGLRRRQSAGRSAAPAAPPSLIDYRAVVGAEQSAHSLPG